MSQGSTVLPTTGVFSGLTEQGSINAALAALLSLNSGGSAPAAPTQFQFWADTSVSGQITVRQYIGTTWVPIWIADTGTGLITLASSSPQNWAAASGTHDAITATYDPPVTALIDGMVLFCRATAANLTQAPTFSPNGLTAHAITKNGGQTLAVGDIPGALAEVALRYNLANTRWELLNPPDVPIGALVPYFGGSIPSGYVLPQGQNLSASTFPAANVVLGTTYGNPGGGNFTCPDMRGRVPAMMDAGGSGRITVAGGNFDGTVLGNTGGAQSHNIAQNQLPNVAPSSPTASFTGTQSNYTVFATGGNSAIVVDGTVGSGLAIGGPGNQVEKGAFAQGTPVGTISVGAVGSINGGVTQQQLATLPPMMTINFMMRVL